MPIVSATTRKKSGATNVAAANASVPSVPMNAVSATTYIVCTVMPAIIGIAMIQSARVGAWRNSFRRSVRAPFGGDAPVGVRALVSAPGMGTQRGRRADGRQVWEEGRRKASGEHR